MIKNDISRLDPFLHYRKMIELRLTGFIRKNPKY